MSTVLALYYRHLQNKIKKKGKKRKVTGDAWVHHEAATFKLEFLINT